MGWDFEDFGLEPDLERIEASGGGVASSISETVAVNVPTH